MRGELQAPGFDGEFSTWNSLARTRANAAGGLVLKWSARNAVGVVLVSAPSGQYVLNQCTHSAVAISTSSIPFHGPFFGSAL